MTRKTTKKKTARKTAKTTKKTAAKKTAVKKTTAKKTTKKAKTKRAAPKTRPKAGTPEGRKWPDRWREPRDLDPTLDPWERQSWESDQAWGAFLAYRGLPPARRTLVAAANLNQSGKGTGKRYENAPRYFRQWGHEHRWKERILAWDREVDRVARAEELEEAKRARRGRRAALTALLMRATEAVGTKEENRLMGGTARDLAIAIVRAARELREEYGEVAPIAVELGGPGGSPLLDPEMVENAIVEAGRQIVRERKRDNGVDGEDNGK